MITSAWELKVETDVGQLFMHYHPSAYSDRYEWYWVVEWTAGFLVSFCIILMWKPATLVRQVARIKSIREDWRVPVQESFPKIKARFCSECKSSRYSLLMAKPNALASTELLWAGPLSRIALAVYSLEYGYLNCLEIDDLIILPHLGQLRVSSILYTVIREIILYPPFYSIPVSSSYATLPIILSTPKRPRTLGSN